MSVKRGRNAKFVAVRRTTEPVRTGNVMTGSRIWTTIVAEITDEGPDEGRLVFINMDPEHAMILSQEMIDISGETQEMRDDVGHTP